MNDKLNVWHIGLYTTMTTKCFLLFSISSWTGIFRSPPSLSTIKGKDVTWEKRNERMKGNTNRREFATVFWFNCWRDSVGNFVIIHFSEHVSLCWTTMKARLIHYATPHTHWLWSRKKSIRNSILFVISFHWFLKCLWYKLESFGYLGKYWSAGGSLLAALDGSIIDISFRAIWFEEIPSTIRRLDPTGKIHSTSWSFFCW